MYDASNGQAGEDLELPRENFENLLKDLKHKNGFVMTVYEFTVMNRQLNEMKNMSNKLIGLINTELKKE